MKTFEDYKTESERTMQVSRKLKWSSEIMSQCAERPRADRPSSLLEEYMSKNNQIHDVRLTLNKKREAMQAHRSGDNREATMKFDATDGE